MFRARLCFVHAQFGAEVEMMVGQARVLGHPGDDLWHCSVVPPLRL
jgi:hypothetical protein